MWVDRLLGSRAIRATELAARFAEARQEVLSENVANIDTPDYHTRSLDREAFESALREALERGGKSQELTLSGRQVRSGPCGEMVVKPLESPAPNALFHDGTNTRLEKLMADAQDNALLYGLTTNLLRGQYERLASAIRGRTT